MKIALRLFVLSILMAGLLPSCAQVPAPQQGETIQKQNGPNTPYGPCGTC